MKAYGRFAAGLALVAGIVGLLFFSNINAFPRILLFYSISFAGFFYIIKHVKNIRNWIAIGWILRILALFAFPALSNDIYRFIWDGWLLTEGQNPFTSTPRALANELGVFQQFLFNEMNSPDYYSVYPPVLQGVFALTSWIIPDNIYWQSFMLKLIMLGCEIITFVVSTRLLHKLALKKSHILIYFLNPLIIVELMGNLHMELIMICFFALFLGAFAQKRYFWGSLFLSLSVAAKLLTLVISPFLLKRLSPKNILLFFLSFGVFMALFFLPMFISTYENFGKGLDLYFQKFEFNASIYYLARTIGFWYKGYNIIGSLGPFLAGISAFTILILAWREKIKSITSLSMMLCIALSYHFFLSTTVHPWYMALLVYLSVFSQLRYPIVWSYLAIFSYAKYYSLGDQFYLPMVGIEYSLLILCIILEYYKRLPGFLLLSRT